MALCVCLTLGCNFIWLQLDLFVDAYMWPRKSQHTLSTSLCVFVTVHE